MRLHEILAPQSIALDVPAGDWQEAVRQAGNYMLMDDGIEERYIQAMIDAVIDIGPYMVVAPGIAIAHARPEHGAKKVCLSIVRLKEPVKFGSSTNDPVDLVFGLAAMDHESHIGALRDLATLLQDADSMQAIHNAEKTDEVYELIRTIQA